jgi:hypothetical protein
MQLRFVSPPAASRICTPFRKERRIYGFCSIEQDDCQYLDELLVLGDHRVQAAGRQAADHLVVLKVVIVTLTYLGRHD